MDRSSKAVLFLALTLALALLAPAAALAAKPDDPGGGGGKKPVSEAGNNLSFPVIAVDGFAITAVTESLTLQYTGTYPGVAESKEYGPTYITDYLDLYGPWYAQKTENKWQASYATRTKGEVTVVDWSDSMEGVYPKANTPFRLEVVLFNKVAEDAATGGLATLDPDTGLAWDPMLKYRMGVLEYPSSKNELQGTHADFTDANGVFVDNQLPSAWATVISSRPKLVVQYLGATVPVLSWDPDQSVWVGEDGSTPRVSQVSFATELNVGGKYIYGASKKGWVPALNGFYRITFYAPIGSQVDMTGAYTGDASQAYAPSAGDAATGYVDAANNLAYIDLEVGGVADPGGDE